MDPRLEDIDKTMAVLDVDDYDNLKGTLASAVLAADADDAPTLRWLAAVCAARAAELDGYEPPED